MSRPPILDELFRALLFNDQDAFKSLESDRAPECLDIRAVVCTDHPGAAPLDLNLGLAASIYVTSIFEGPRAFFMSRHVSVQTRFNGGQSAILLDYSLSFDSNFAEKLRATINGEKIQPVDRARIVDVLMLKANNPRVQFDVVPFLYENIRLARENEANRRPLNTLIAFRMLDRLNWDAFRNNPDRFDFGESVDSLKSSLEPEANSFLTSELSNSAVLHHEAKALGIQALLLRLATLWHERKKPDALLILGKLFEFSLTKLGFLPMTELSLIWTGISSKQVAAFFGPIIGRSKTMLKDIRGMAWDMAHLRLMEQTARQSLLGSFYVPYFVSIDVRWRQLLALNPVRFMLVDDASKNILFARAKELEFQVACNECASFMPDSERTPEKIEARRRAALTINVDAMKKLVSEEERIWR